MTIDERIEWLESQFVRPGGCPGTAITRQMKEQSGAGFRWVLALGHMLEPKDFFIGETIEEAVAAAETSVLAQERMK